MSLHKMTKKAATFFIVLFIVCFFAMQSCRKEPSACFTTSVNIDSIRVNIPVTFNALCSSDANIYDWQINAPDTQYVAFQPTFTVTFNDTGKVAVLLLVFNGTQPNSITDTIHVGP